jgi:hypothetical protein
MTRGKSIVVQQYDQATGQTTYRFLVDEEALTAANEWIARNRGRLPAPNEIGMVMPEFVIHITEDGEISASTTETLEIYCEIDSKGTIAVPREEIAAFMEIVMKWGRISADATRLP